MVESFKILWKPNISSPMLLPVTLVWLDRDRVFIHSVCTKTETFSVPSSSAGRSSGTSISASGTFISASGSKGDWLPESIGVSTAAASAMASSTTCVCNHITNDFSWHTHIHNVINNANCTLGYLHYNFAQVPSSLKLLLYRTLIRPKLEYASSIWDPAQHPLIDATESVQKRSVRFILSICILLTFH